MFINTLDSVYEKSIRRCEAQMSKYGKEILKCALEKLMLAFLLKNVKKICTTSEISVRWNYNLSTYHRVKSASAITEHVSLLLHPCFTLIFPRGEKEWWKGNKISTAFSFFEEGIVSYRKHHLLLWHSPFPHFVLECWSILRHRKWWDVAK